MRQGRNRTSNGMSKTYKGIAIFGTPASGKTAISLKLEKRLPGSKHLEVFDELIEPTLRKSPHIKGESVRERARQVFGYLKNKYGQSAIGKLVTGIHKRKYKKQFIIISGIRGLENAQYLKREGYLIVFLSVPASAGVKRLMEREGYSKDAAVKDYKEEETIYKTSKVKSIADLILDTSGKDPMRPAAALLRFLGKYECKKCVNNIENPVISIDKDGLCQTCALYKSKFNPKVFRKELKFFKAFANRRGKYNAMVGISGGKDSTAVLYRMVKFGFRPLAFTFDTGYYSDHIFSRSAEMAENLGVSHERIDIRTYVRKIDRISYRKTAELYDLPYSDKLQARFRGLYEEGREHYSVKCGHSIPFVRTCQLCRRVVIRAYYGEAVKRGINLVVLGINEWTGLSRNNFTAIRKLKPFKNKPAVYIVHLPFLIQAKIGDTQKILRKIGWKEPRGELLIESNANSCLFARAAENKARKLLGFHPDSTRLGREVTASFISKEQALKALRKRHGYSYSVREVLEKAGVTIALP
ncbi:MAG: hypothetical protein UW79_C0023G0001 [Candidatus Yanofskybacteria bacterium GW2011_GWA2_44_9]|uniref:NAD/GMP synthase domain-containing protein n=2 Tax=Candidatus Yanofskyibacteriota TaxID=1752733 RepID=A0A0G1KCA6_9BACT|nr:MAG: hypothetical protein UW79_C0023G0001 [Candidatus Yanofskybacteria bacterium GW2011_GWA2_44_9]